MTQALDRMAAETSAMRRVVESITTDQVRMQAEIKLLTSQLERAERELNKKIDDNSLRKAWANLTSIVAGLASLLALLIAMGVIKGAQ